MQYGKKSVVHVQWAKNMAEVKAEKWETILTRRTCGVGNIDNVRVRQSHHGTEETRVRSSNSNDGTVVLGGLVQGATKLFAQPLSSLGKILHSLFRSIEFVQVRVSVMLDRE